MYHQSARSLPRLGRVGLLLVLTATTLLGAAPARAQVGDTVNVVNLLIPGAYFLTSGSGRDALQSTLYYREAEFFRHGLGIGIAGVSGGVKVISAGSQLLPFSGSDQLLLIGPSVTVSTARVAGWRPHASIGLFAGRVKSDQRGIDRWDFTPSLAVGVSYSFARLVTLTAEYRVTEEIGGINTDGVALRLSLF
ncbi:MAG: hypothetical protein GX774_20900 [Armatimonadetes bacterium]|jgi:hypothetical protein|nr:hypothetical protein [Armatimonadota bacterium]